MVQHALDVGDAGAWDSRPHGQKDRGRIGRVQCDDGACRRLRIARLLTSAQQVSAHEPRTALFDRDSLHGARFYQPPRRDPPATGRRTRSMAVVAGSSVETRTERLQHELEQYRSELTAYCYRMLGSPFEAEDAVQETLVRAWRGLDRFEGRSALRSWLYRIATNVCLDMLDGRERRARPMDLSAAWAPDGPVGRTLPETTWIEPAPDGLVSAERDPAEVAAQRETIRLAFIAALQHLAPRQRAVLILGEVLRWKATEIAELLDTSVASVNSALQRARATLRERGVSATDPTPALDESQEEPLSRYVEAFERYDMDALTALLHADGTHHHSSLMQVLDKLTTDTIVGQKRSGEMRVPCKVGATMVVLTDVGHVRPCEILEDDLGDIRDFDFDLHFACSHPYILESEEMGVLRIGPIVDYAAEYEEKQNLGLRLVNSPAEHARASELEVWYPLIKELTPRTMVFNALPTAEEIEANFAWPVFLTVSEKWTGSVLSDAKSTHSLTVPS